jgi:hypothetical protein
MPKGYPNVPNNDTQSIPVENDPSIDAPWVVSEEEHEEIFDGLPELQRGINLSRIAGENPSVPIPPSLTDVPENMVVLLNLRFPQEKFYIPQPGTDGAGRNGFFFSGPTATAFVDGRAMVTEERADFIQERAPYVMREPDSGPILSFDVPGGEPFYSRLPAAISEYARQWAADQ